MQPRTFVNSENETLTLSPGLKSRVVQSSQVSTGLSIQGEGSIATSLLSPASLYPSHRGTSDKNAVQRRSIIGQPPPTLSSTPMPVMTMPSQRRQRLVTPHLSLLRSNHKHPGASWGGYPISNGGNNNCSVHLKGCHT